MNPKQALETINKIIYEVTGEERRFFSLYYVNNHLIDMYIPDVAIRYWKDESNSFAERDMIREHIRGILCEGGPWDGKDDSDLTRIINTIKERVKDALDA